MTPSLKTIVRLLHIQAAQLHDIADDIEHNDGVSRSTLGLMWAASRSVHSIACTLDKCYL